jgi:hypothetical protein
VSSHGEDVRFCSIRQTAAAAETKGFLISELKLNFQRQRARAAICPERHAGGTVRKRQKSPKLVSV